MPLVGPAGNQVVDDPLEIVVSSGHGKPPGDDGGLNRSPVKNAPALRASASRYSLRLAGKRTLQYAAHRRMLPVLHLHPILRPAALIRPVAALRHQSLQSHVAGGAKQARTDLTLLEGRDEDAVR